MSRELLKKIKQSVLRPQDEQVNVSLSSVLTDYVSEHEGDALLATRLDEDLRNLYRDDLQTTIDKSVKSLVVLIFVLRHLGACLPLESLRAFWLDLVVVTRCLKLKNVPQPALQDIQELFKTALSRDDGGGGDDRFRRKVFEDYLARSTPQKSAADDDLDQAWFKMLEQAFLSMGRTRARDLFTLVHVYYVRGVSYRLQLQHLLALFFGQNGAYAHHILHTPLLNTLLISLQLDTSTTLLSIALNNLIMLMPCLAYAIIPYLPQLYAIFGRVICWDINIKQTRRDQDSNLPSEDLALVADLKWQVLHYSFDSTPSTVPDVTRFFTFLYGLYPCNIILFLRGPLAYLKKAKYQSLYQGRLQDFFDEEAIRNRSLLLLRRHTIAPGIVTYNYETELTDTSRWQQVEAADVVSACTSLYIHARSDEQGTESSGHAKPSAESLLANFQSAKESQVDESDPETNTGRLEREILLLQNELNFELYLNQQHVQHIARLRRDQISDHSVEAERQNLLNHTKTIERHLALSEAKQAHLRAEANASRAKKQKWEVELSDRLGVLLAEKRTWDNSAQDYRVQIESLNRRLADQTLLLDEVQSRNLELSTELAVLQPRLKKMMASEERVRELTKELIFRLQDTAKQTQLEQQLDLLSDNWLKLELVAKSRQSKIEELEMALLEKNRQLQKAQTAGKSSVPMAPTPGAQIGKMRHEIRNLLERNALLEEELHQTRLHIQEIGPSSSSSRSTATGH